MQVDEKQHRRAKHRDGDGQAVCCLHVRRALEQQHHDDAARPHDLVDERDVELALGLGRIEHLQVRHEVQAARLGNERERAGDERLGGDDGREHGEDHAERTHHAGEHLEEGVEVLDGGEFRVAGISEQPRALAEVAQDEARLHEGPGCINVALAHVAHVRVERLGAGGGEEAAAQDHDAGVVVGAEQELQAVHRVDGEQDLGVREGEEQAGDS